MVKKKILFFLLAFSFTNAQEVIEIKLIDGRVVTGEFIGTYMGHVYLLDGENLNHFDCNDIENARKFGYIKIFEYDCNKNTVTKDILFPPQLNPMTGEWEVLVPDFLNPDKVSKPTKKEKKLNSNFISNQEVSKRAMVNKTLLNQKLKQKSTNIKVGDESNYSSAEIGIYNLTDKLTEQELRKIIRKEVRKELRKVLPYEIEKQNEKKQANLFQNILLGCGAWFIFMLILS